MPMFRKRPIVIEAWPNWTGDAEFDGAPGKAVRYPDWLEDAFARGNVKGGPMGSFLISTLEGVMRADVGDWIIQGVKGEMYPCKPDVFAATYEPVEPR